MSTKPSSRSPGTLAGVGLGLIVILFLAVNLFAASALTSWRIDLTENKLYTLSDATRRVLSQIEEPITIRFFFSKSLAQRAPGVGTYAKRVQDLLGEYVNEADGKLILEVYDPQPFSEVEDRAVSFGLQPVPIGSGSANVFFGLVASNTTDDVEAIPFIQGERENFLEYDLSKMIYKLAKLDPPVVGILSGVPINGGFRINPSNGRQEVQQPFAVYKQIDELFETRVLNANVAEIPEDITALLIAKPDDFSEQTLFAIDQYVLGGGKALVFVDPHTEIDQDPQRNVMKSLQGDDDADQGFGKLLKSWGVSMVPDTIVGDRFAARKVSAGQSRRTVPYIPWLMLRGNNIDRSSPITADIELLALASAGVLQKVDGAATDVTPVLKSSPGSMTLNPETLGQRPQPEKLLADYKAGTEIFTMGARITGPAQTAFPDGRPKADGEQGETETTEPLKKSKGPVELIVIADVDMLADHFWVQYGEFFGRQIPTPVANNGDFVVNVLEAFSGNSELLELRGRTGIERPFTVIQDLQSAADQQFEKKERELRETLAKTEEGLKALRGRGSSADGISAILSEEDRREIQKLQRDILKVRTELRAVQRSLDLEVEKLETRILFYNMAAVPIAISLVAIVLSVLRARRRRRALAGLAASE